MVSLQIKYGQSRPLKRFPETFYWTEAVGMLTKHEKLMLVEQGPLQGAKCRGINAVQHK